MAELNDILASGSVGDIKQNTHSVVDVSTLDSDINQYVVNGLPIPEVADSFIPSNGTMFWDLSTGKLRYKSVGGILLEFKMQLA